MSTLATRTLLAAGAGSALGAVARYSTSLWMLAAFGPAFPWGTLSVNVLGSFLIGLFAARLAGDAGRNHATRQFLLAGFCGGFTTFSIFSLETLLLIERREIAVAAFYVAASLILWFAAAAAGHRLAVKLNGTNAPW